MSLQLLLAVTQGVPEPPRLTHVEIDRSTVWFLSQPGPAGRPASYAFDRRRADALPVPPAPAPEPAPRWPARPGERVALGDGFELVLEADAHWYRPTVWSVQAHPLDRVPASEAAAMAVERARRGDSSAYHWLRSAVYNPRPGTDLVPVIEAVGELRYEAAVVPLANLLRYGAPPEQDAAYRALLRIATAEAWRQLGDKARQHPPLQQRLVVDVLREEPYLPLADPGFRAMAIEAARLALRPADAGMRADAAAALVKLRATEAVPQLVALLMQSAEDYAIANGALIRLTAVDSVPAPPSADAAQRRIAWRFWNEWWDRAQLSSLGRFVNRWWPGEPPGWLLKRRPVPAASPEDGAAALERWRQRWAGGS